MSGIGLFGWRGAGRGIQCVPVWDFGSEEEQHIPCALHCLAELSDAEVKQICLHVHDLAFLTV